MPRYVAVDNTSAISPYAGWELMDTEAIPPKTFGVGLPEHEAKFAASAMNLALDQTMRIVELVLHLDQLRQTLKMARAAKPVEWQARVGAKGHWRRVDPPAGQTMEHRVAYLRDLEVYEIRALYEAPVPDVPGDARKDIAYLLEAYRYGQFADDMFGHPSADCRSPCKPLREALRRHLDWLESTTIKDAP